MTHRDPGPGTEGRSGRGSGVELSVVTATIGRREKMLRKLEALRRQSLAPQRFEWVVCDNGSSDGTAEALKGEPREFALRTLRVTRNLGPSAGRNAAVSLARGKVLYLSDDDCLPEPDALELHLKAQDRPCVAIGAVIFRDELNGVEESTWTPRKPGYWNVNGANTSIPAASFREVGGFDEKLSGYGGEDVLLGYRLSRSGLPLRAVPQARVVHLGPNPASGDDLEKAGSAGSNAARIAAMHPELRYRLGVHPLLLRAKLALLPPLVPILGARVAGDLAYARGAWQVVTGGQGQEGAR